MDGIIPHGDSGFLRHITFSIRGRCFEKILSRKNRWRAAVIGGFMLSGLVMVFFPQAAKAAGGKVLISPNGYVGFSVQAINVTGVKSWSMYFTYDADSMTNLHVDATPLLRRGNFRADTSSPGVITVSASSGQPTNYPGNLLNLRFDLTGEKPGKIYSAQIYVTSSNGAYQQIPVTIVNPQDPPDTKKDPAESATGASEKDAAGVLANGTAVSPDQPPTPGRKADAETEAGSHPDRTAAGSIGAKSADRIQAGAPLPNSKPVTFYQAKSALDRFSELSIFTDRKVLLEILGNNQDNVFRQQPSVALSDGKTSVTVTANLGVMGEKPPIFLLQGARIISLKIAADNVWKLEVMPKRGVYMASVSACYDNRIAEFPLNVAPPLEWHLQKRAGGSKWTYLDYYVYTVNSLANPGRESGLPAQIH